MSDEKEMAVGSSGALGEISQGPPVWEVFLDRHQGKLVVLGILIVIAVAVGIVVKGVNEGNERAAGAMLSKASSLIDYQGIVRNHEGTAAAASARVLLAEMQWEEGQQDTAIETLRVLVEGGGRHPALPGARASLGAKLLSQGKSDEAVSIFKDLADDPAGRHLVPYAWISLGDIEASRGNVDAAENAYKTVTMDFPSSSFAAQAGRRLALLKAKSPEEVEAPIEVPEVNLGGDDEELSGDVDIENLIDAVRDGSLPGTGNPLFDGGAIDLPEEE